eukprot:c27030_g1_i1 orf=360-2276(+)
MEASQITCFFFALLLFFLRSRAHFVSQGIANTPPRGWNSYDSYSWIVSEEEFLQNAQRVADDLLAYGYEYVVVDFLWYRRRAPGASVSSPGFDVIDKWGRPIPDPERWPSSAGGNGFKPIADKVHAMGLKFGIHVMRGISTEAVNNNTPILGAPGWRAADIALQNQACSWMSACFVSVDESTLGGHAFIQSLYDLYASWDVDFVKHDCVFGVDDLSVHEIKAVSEAIIATGRPMVYSISPGVRATPSMATLINGLVNMYRVTSDDWDSWTDVEFHFNVARDFAAAGLIGALGLNGSSWPDLDMLPLGYLTDPGANAGPHRFCQLTLDEQMSQVTLWAMVKSPLMFGGDMLHLNQETMDLLTNRVVLDINAYSFGSIELQGSTSYQANVPTLTVMECGDANGTKWSMRSSSSSNELCWSFSSGTKGSLEVPTDPAGCMNWIPSSVILTPFGELNQGTTKEQTSHVGYGYLLSPSNEEICLDSHADKLSEFDSFRSKHMVACSLNGSQTWQLSHEGQLISDTTGLCGAISVTGAGVDENILGGSQQTYSRIWASRGPSGEYYVAFFNLGPEPSVISIPLVNIIKGTSAAKLDILDRRSTSDYQCTGSEVWSSDNLGLIGETLSAQVLSHGCALFSLQCYM